MALSENRIIDVLKQVVPEEDAERILFYLRGKSNISEFIIAEELDLEIHRTRNLLYKLLDVNLVSFKRKKDKIKGWYICYWDFNETIIPHLEEKLRMDTIKKLKNRLDNEAEGFFYMCRFAHTRQGFEEAFEYNFKCPECGELMNQVDNSRTIEFLKKRISDLEEVQAQFEAEREVVLSESRKKAEKILEAERKRAQELEKRKQDLLAKRQLAEQKAKEKEAKEKESNEQPVKKEPSKKAETTKTVSKKSPVKKVTVKKTVAKKTVSKKSPVKKTTKKTTTKSVSKPKKTIAKKIGGLFKK